MILAPENCMCPLIDETYSIVNSPVCSGTVLFMLLLEGFLKGRCDIADPCSRVDSIDNVEEEYDFIVVGAGPGGSIAAGRLSENENFKVLVLEAGIQEPIGARPPSFYRTFWSNKDLDWDYRTMPGDYCLDQGEKGCLWPRGKVLGGSSVLNGMMYHRGHAADYEDWVQAGAKGWSWEDNLPYFDRSEGNKEIGSLVSGKYHSDAGPMPVQRFNHQPEAVYTLLRAINETGFPVITDMNDPNTPEGFTIAQAFNQNGQRYTPARAFLMPKWARPNLSVKLNAHVTRVVIKRNRAVAVEFVNEVGDRQIVRASKEVILSAGALNTPNILMHSGVGPRETLERFNIPVKADLPVGQNLRNHVGITLTFMLKELKNVETLNWNAAMEYLLTRKGPMSSTGITQLTGILYSSLADRSRRQPDIQFFFNGFYADCSRTGGIDEPAVECPENGLNVTANAALLLPRSIGYLTLNSSNPLDPPLFYANFFSHPDDMRMMMDAGKYLQQIFESPLLQEQFGLELDRSTSELCSPAEPEWSEPWIECMTRLHTDAQNHQLGTAAIGQVIDPQLRVYNIRGLRVIDASAMPTQPTGNPQAAIMMVAERGAQFIKDAYAR